MDYIAQPKDYWIALQAIKITLNALGNPNRMQGSVASGAAILCYIEGVDGLGYDNGHRFRTWPLAISPTYFNSNTEKYVYVAIPRSEAVGTQAIVVFPSEQLDIYGKNVGNAQIGSTDYYYIWLQGIITATDGTSNREWQQAIDFGKKGTDEDLYDDTTSEWYVYSKVSEVVTFLKNITMKTGTTFHNLILGNKELTGVATSDIAYTDSDALVATPGYVESQYLSKTHESEAQEQIGFLKGLWIGTKNLYEITADGIAKLKSVIAEDVNSQRVQTGEIKSPNYTGDSVTDTGFLLTNNYNGHSKLTIDEIYVRMKAVFESLEVRERTYTGGDQIWSCAGNRISRVDYLGNVETADHVPQMMNVHADGRIAEPGDEEESYSVPVPGDTYGYSDIKVPWLLRAVPLLARAKVFARYRKVRIVINEPAASSANRAAASESPLANIRRARCYFLAKDDDMEVHNWWRINDLARCQTMNLANTTRQTYISGEDQKAGNIFWWRKVIGVSYEPVTLDDGKQYHYFDVAFDYLLEQEHPEEMATSVMEGSDIPAAQDSVVQFGNTIIEGRMNLMMMEVNGSDAVGYNPTTDAPCLKAYRGIYCFDLNKSWVGGNARKMMLSPKSGYEFYGPNFKQVTEYDVVPVPVDRGLWTNICRTKNSSGEYIDEWQFEKDDYGRTVEYSDDDVTGRTTGVRKCYYYDKVSRNGSYWLCSIVDGAHWVDGNGDYLSDDAYSALTEEQKALCSRKQNYTIEEPSANSIDWTEVVQKGDNMVRLDIDNEMDAVQTDSTGKVTVQRTVTTVVHLYDGATDVTINNPTVSGISYTDSNGQQQTLNPVITASGNGKQLSWTFLVGWVLQASYQVSISYTYQGVSYNTVFTLTASQGMAIFQLKPSLSAISFQRDGNNQLTPASNTLGLSILKIDGGSTADITPSTYGVSKIRYSLTEMPTLVSSGSAWPAAGTITVPNTTENVYIALFNASDVLIDKETVPIIKDGEKGEQGVSSFTSHVFKRQNSQPDAPTGGSYSSPVPSGWSDGVPDGTAMVWMSTRIFSSNGNAPQQSGWTTPRQMTDTADFDLEFSSVASNPGNPTDNPSNWSNTSSSSTIWMATRECHNGVWSAWQIVKIKGENGSDGSYYVEDYGISASRTDPSDISSWSPSQPEPTAQKPYVWKRSRLYNPNTQTYGNATYVCLTGEKGVNGKDGWMITANPANVIITQALGNDTTQFPEVKVGFTAKKGNVSATVSSLAIPTGQQALSNEFNAAIGTGDDSKKVIVSSPKTYTPQGGTAQYYTEGTFVVDVIVTDPDTGSSVTFNVTVPCYANLLGTWKETVESGEETIAASKIEYVFSASGSSIELIKTDYNSKRNSIGNYETWSSNNNTSEGSKRWMNEHINTAEQNISRLESRSDSRNMLDCASGDGWKEWDEDTETPYNDSIQSIGETNDDVDTYSRAVFLKAGVSYTFSLYAPSSPTVGFYRCNYNPNALSDSLTFVSSLQKQALQETYQECTRYYGVFTPAVDDYYKIDIYNIENPFYRPQLEVGETPTTWVPGSQKNSSSEIRQTADEIEAKVNNTGVNISKGEVTVYGGKFSMKPDKNSAATFELDENGNLKSKGNAQFEGKVKATSGEFTGKVTATSGEFTGDIYAKGGTIGGFTIDDTGKRFYNSDWGAGIDIDPNDGRNVKIGKNAQGVIGTESAIIRAENTRSNQTYNTALYLNAQNGTYNYAFYGNGNGVLNGLMFGYKVQLHTIPSGNNDAVTYLNINSGSTIILNGSHSDGNVWIAAPKLSDVRKCLGINSSTTPFAIEFTVVSHAYYEYVGIAFRNAITETQNSEYPWLMNTDDGHIGEPFGTPSIQIAQGDVVKMLLLYDNVGTTSSPNYEYRAYDLIRRV